MTTVLSPAPRGPSVEEVPELRAGDRLSRLERQRTG